jgi:hypothetical protein
MCKDKNCFLGSCNGSYCEGSMCYCNGECYPCWRVNNSSHLWRLGLCASDNCEIDHGKYGMRRKYICFECKVVWGNKYTERAAKDWSGYCLGKYDEDLEDTIVVLDKKSKCAGCSKTGLIVGSAFRAPPKKNVKEWNSLENNFKTGKIDLFWDFIGKNKKTKKLAEKIERSAEWMEKKITS